MAIQENKMPIQKNNMAIFETYLSIQPIKMATLPGWTALGWTSEQGYREEAGRES